MKHTAAVSSEKCTRTLPERNWASAARSTSEATTSSCGTDGAMTQMPAESRPRTSRRSKAESTVCIDKAAPAKVGFEELATALRPPSSPSAASAAAMRSNRTDQRASWSRVSPLEGKSAPSRASKSASPLAARFERATRSLSIRQTSPGTPCSMAFRASARSAVSSNSASTSECARSSLSAISVSRL